MKFFNIIVAVNKYYGIGWKNTFPWESKKDMKFFKDTTQNCVVIMGRKTFESMRCIPLKNRVNIIITRNDTYSDNEKLNLYYISSLDDALKICDIHFNDKEIFVIGGEQIYNDAVIHSKCKYIYVSYINDCSECDAFFPYKYVIDNYKLSDIIIDGELCVHKFLKMSINDYMDSVSTFTAKSNGSHTLSDWYPS